MRNRRRLRTLLFELALVIAVLGPARAAEGSFPGTNGRLAVSLGFFPQECRVGDTAGETVTLRPDRSRSRARLKCVTPRGFDDVTSPDWSPDGRRLLAASSRGVVLMVADGSHARAVTSPPDVGELILEPSFAPDGRRFVYERIDESGASIWRATIGRRTERRLAFGDAPRWSPDGRTIAYTRSSSSDRVFIMSARTGRRIRRLAEGARAVAWSPAGRWLLVAAGGDGGVLIVRANGTGAARDVLIRGGGKSIEDAAWSPDGRRLAVTGVEHDDEQARHSVWTMSPRSTAQKRVFQSDWVDSEETGSPLVSWGARPD